MLYHARAFWVRSPGVGEIRSVSLASPGDGEVLVRTLFTAVSRGTETLVFAGAVPASQADVMRAPFQEGDFPGPVKYGYLNVGVVEEGPPELRGRTVFCLYPHQTHYVVPSASVLVVPDEVPPSRAVLAGTVETAVNALWDVPPLVGDRVTVVGAGMVGCTVAALLGRFPGFAAPAEAVGDQDLVVHASATEAGLAQCLDLITADGTVVELSWYGDRTVAVPLGGRFHSGRLRVRSSQVGTVSPARAYRYTHGERRAVALRLLRDPVFDVLLSGASPFEDLPAVLASLASGDRQALAHLITYERA
jgi:NADPH:quinone reductase-like Zn-dependent oxidoreductase